MFSLSVSGASISTVPELTLSVALRFYPVFPLLGRVALCDTQLPIGGGNDGSSPIFVPKGSTVVISHYALNRDRSVFGQNIDDFDPDRWNTICPEQWQFMPFGGGQRACMGQQKALVEASYVLVRLAQSFDSIESRDPAPWKGELNLTWKKVNGCKVSFHKDLQRIQ
jgi:cytochrome P450